MLRFTRCGLLICSDRQGKQESKDGVKTEVHRGHLTCPHNALIRTPGYSLPKILHDSVVMATYLIAWRAAAARRGRRRATRGNGADIFTCSRVQTFLVMLRSAADTNLRVCINESGGLGKRVDPTGYPTSQRGGARSAISRDRQPT